jgi:hypothetical protein
LQQCQHIGGREKSGKEKREGGKQYRENREYDSLLADILDSHPRFSYWLFAHDVGALCLQLQAIHAVTNRRRATELAGILSDRGSCRLPLVGAYYANPRLDVLERAHD